MSENILIVGSKGFIGSHVLAYYRKKSGVSAIGADVVVDYRDTEYVTISPDNSDFQGVFREKSFSLCINCSGAASVPDSLKNPSRDYELNAHNVLKILEAIRTFSPKCRFINLSSAAVYGNPESLPIKEDQRLGPVSPYGFHKLYAEQMCSEYNRFFGIGTCSLRIFSAYGDGLFKQLFYDLYKKAASGEKISLFGTGNESRDFIHVTDIVRIIELVHQNGVFQGEKINVANGEEVSIAKVVSIFYKNFPQAISYRFSGEERKGDPSNWVADISAVEKMGYTPSVNLEKGLKDYYEWVCKEG